MTAWVAGTFAVPTLFPTLFDYVGGYVGEYDVPVVLLDAGNVAVHSYAIPAVWLFGVAVWILLVLTTWPTKAKAALLTTFGLISVLVTLSVPIVLAAPVSKETVVVTDGNRVTYTRWGIWGFEQPEGTLCIDTGENGPPSTC
jgi:hypothetical protein